MRFQKLLTILLIMSFMLTACGTKPPAPPQDALQIHSPDGSTFYVTPDEYPYDLAEDPEYFKYGYNVYVSALYGDLTLSGNTYDGFERTPTTSSHLCYEFENWFGNQKGVFLDNNLILEEACYGMISSYGRDKLLIITYDDTNTFIRGAKHENDTWQLEDDKITLDGEPKMMYYNWQTMHSEPSDLMYLITKTSFFRLSVLHEYLEAFDAELNIIQSEAFPVPDYWITLHPTSMVEIDDVLYIGDQIGFAAVAWEKATIVYYPYMIRTR